MKRSFLAVGLIFVMGLTVSASTRIRVYSAQYVSGKAVVKGRANAWVSIYWQGTKVATADRHGSFSFTGVMPTDCSGRLSNGRSTVSVLVKTSRTDYVCDGNASAAPVAQTGQTTSYFPDDDGDERAGITQPTPRFTDNLDGTIADNLTGLIWLKNANCTGGPASSQQNAMVAVANLNATGAMNTVDCGDVDRQTDWRLPNIKELESLINYGFSNPAFSGASGLTAGTANDPFSNFQIASGYWSSTTFAGDSTVAWGINYSAVTPIVGNGSKTFAGYVLAVRGGSF